MRILEKQISGVLSFCVVAVLSLFYPGDPNSPKRAIVIYMRPPSRYCVHPSGPLGLANLLELCCALLAVAQAMA